jgi:diguanylate cyclase (GGDEF)-like protein
MDLNRPGRRGAPKRLLVIEDDPTLGRLLSMVLRQQTEQVATVHTGRDALRAAHQGFDAAACDISLPDMSGLDVIEELRSVEPTSGIVAITGLVDVDVAVRSMKAGADDFLAKPFDPEILWHMLNKAVDSRSQRIEASQAEAYRQLAYTDALTGCPNRRFIDEFLEDAVARSRRTGEPLTVAYLDIDNFKLLNDFVGHEEGDRVLRAVAKALPAQVHEPAAFGRFGGDEFVVVFPGATAAAAHVTIDGIRALVAGIQVANETQTMLPVRVSCGIARFHGSESPRGLVASAEDRMYLDKSLAPTLMHALQPASGEEIATFAKVSNLKALRSLVKAIDRRDSYTRFHSDHATQLALQAARRLDLTEEERSAVMIGGPIHDLGKIVVPDKILRKPGLLTMDERHQMEEHPVIGAAITAAVTDYDVVVSLVRHHHERFDGNGYPAGLAGSQISLPTRLFTLADAFSAMTTDRPYRKGLTLDQALSQVALGAGTQFDPDLAKIFAEVVAKEQYEGHRAA